LARRAAREGLSVRRIEQLAAQERRPGGRAATPPRDPYVEDLENRLRKALGTTVTLKARAGGAGRIEVAFHDANELDRLLELFGAS
jgi:ParB family chromosome partitioning protein